jgi:hypothetical protein
VSAYWTGHWGIRSPIFERLASRQNEASSRAVPEVGLSDVIIENDERDFEPGTFSGIDDFDR